MIYFLTALNLHVFPTLTDSMFRDRAAQFHNRLHWDVAVDANEWERDEYDSMFPVWL